MRNRQTMTVPESVTEMTEFEGLTKNAEHLLSGGEGEYRLDAE
jgi:hypothetical protein